MVNSRAFLERVFTVLAVAMGGTMVLSNILAVKIWGFTLGSATLTFDAGLVIYPLTFVLGDILVEFYGARRADQVAWHAALINVAALVCLTLAELLPNAPGVANPDFGIFVQSSFWVFLGSTVGFLAGQLANHHVFERLRLRFGARHLIVRVIGSSLAARLVDLIFFNMLAYFGRLEGSALLLHIFYAYCAGTLVELACYPFTHCAIHLIRHRCHHLDL